MARVTVEDCIDKVTNRFELVMVSGKRARQISSGAPLTIDRDNDKNAVVSLREIASETVSVDNLREEVIKNYQTTVEPDVLEEDMEELTFDDDDGATEMMAGMSKYTAEEMGGEQGLQDEMEILESLSDMGGDIPAEGAEGEPAEGVIPAVDKGPAEDMDEETL